MKEHGNSEALRPLGGPQMPADGGVTGLGLVMQLGGSIYLGLMAMVTVVAIAAGDDGPGALVLFGIVGMLRSGVHRAAGSELIDRPLADHGRDPWRLTRLYAALAMMHSALTLFVMHTEAGADGAVLWTAGLLLVAWPMTLLALTMTSWARRYAHAPTLPDDRGYESAGVLMLLFGVAGAIFGVVLLLVVVGADTALAHFEGWLLLLGIALLSVRSVVHARAGATATRATPDPAGFSSRAVDYVNWGVVTSVVIALLSFLVMAMNEAEGTALVMIVVIVYLLLAWPLVVRRLVVGREVPVFSDLDEGHGWQRAPDRGMTALGWLLVALGVLGSVSALSALFTEESARMMSGQARLVMSGSLVQTDLAAMLGRSPWLSIAMTGLQLWAGIELVTMSRRWKLAATVYGVSVAIITAYVVMPVFEEFEDAFSTVLGGGLAQVVIFGQMALALVLPVGTAVLANRQPSAGGPAPARVHDLAG